MGGRALLTIYIAGAAAYLIKEAKRVKSKRARACDISQKVKAKVWERDGGACVVCGCPRNVMPNAHYISRAKGGLGIEENIVTLCTGFTANDCHNRFDNGTAAERAEIGAKIEAYLRARYPNWSPDKLVYRKNGGEAEMSVSIRIAVYGRVRVMAEGELKNGAWEYCDEGKTVSSSRVQASGRVYQNRKTGEAAFLPYSEGRAAVQQYIKEWKDGSLYA